MGLFSARSDRRNSDTASVEAEAVNVANEEVEVSVGKTRIKFGMTQVGCRID